MQITIEVRSVYGKLTVYPVCDKAKTFAKIAGTKTLSHANLCAIESLGYAIVSTASPNWNTRRVVEWVR